VCEGRLKDHRDRKLTHDDLERNRNVVTALSETIRLMAEIDVVISKRPIERFCGATRNHNGDNEKAIGHG
jgi:hypothetical protein